MKKLKLQIDELAVESFQTAADHEGRGTVQGNDETGVWSQCASACLTMCDASDCTNCTAPTAALRCTWQCGTGGGGGGGGDTMNADTCTISLCPVDES
jgi:hypothetical protein